MDDNLGKPLITTRAQPRIPTTTRPKVEEVLPPPPVKKKDDKGKSASKT